MLQFTLQKVPNCSPNFSFETESFSITAECVSQTYQNYATACSTKPMIPPFLGIQGSQKLTKASKTTSTGQTCNRQSRTTSNHVIHTNIIKTYNKNPLVFYYQYQSPNTVGTPAPWILSLSCHKHNEVTQLSWL